MGGGFWSRSGRSRPVAAWQGKQQYGGQNTGKAQQIGDGKICAQPEGGKYCCGNRLQAAEQSAFYRADPAHSVEEEAIGAYGAHQYDEENPQPGGSREPEKAGQRAETGVGRPEACQSR